MLPEPSRPSLVEFVKGHPIVALSAYTIFLIGTVCLFIKSVGVKNFDYFGVRAEIANLEKDLHDQRAETLKAEKETLTAKNDCQTVQTSAAQLRNDLANVRDSLSRCESARRGPQPAQPQVVPIRRIVPSEWKHEPIGNVTGAAVADRLTQLGVKPENVAVFYDRATPAFHIWYLERATPDRQVRYEYMVGLPNDLGEHPGVNFFKQDAVTLPIGIGGSSPLPIYFRVEHH